MNPTITQIDSAVGRYCQYSQVESVQSADSTQPELRTMPDLVVFNEEADVAAYSEGWVTVPLSDTRPKALRPAPTGSEGPPATCLLASSFADRPLLQPISGRSIRNHEEGERQSDRQGDDNPHNVVPMGVVMGDGEEHRKVPEIETSRNKSQRH